MSHVQFNEFSNAILQLNLVDLCNQPLASQPRFAQQVAGGNSKRYSARDSAIRMNHRESRLLAWYYHNVHVPVAA